MLSFEEYREIVNSNLTDLVPELPEYSERLSEAMKYSLEAPGKRLRPVLLLAACDFAGGSIDDALPYALAVEYIHTYSLIHDDLPAMDNDDLRRGRPTNHKMYGEDIAILAGDALLSTAAEIVTKGPLLYTGNPAAVSAHIKAGAEIMSRAGAAGMIAGQTADVLSENEDAESSAELVSYIEEHKTADLITAPVRAGLFIAEASDDMLASFTEYAKSIGVAFQILDDILDVEGDQKLMGKTLGKDEDQGKCSYVYVHGMDKAKDELKRLTDLAKSSIEAYGESAAFFTELADSLMKRNN